MVYVLDFNGQPLMPSQRHGKIKRLLRNGQAKVIKRCPFTIKLLYETTNYKQNLTLGVDTGSKFVGTGVCRENGNVVYTSQVQLRTDIHFEMVARAKYRRSRRTRKTRYRPCRFLNRRNSTKLNRLPPSIKSKIWGHICEIESIKKILPITNLVLEVAEFDPHLMQNPELANKKTCAWGYQHGLNYGFSNTRAMVFSRDNYTCQYCKGKHKDSRLHAHHIIFRSQGGADSANNLITLCKTCHDKLHKGEISLDKIGKKKGTLSHATQMNVIRTQLLAHYPNATITYGYITTENRKRLGVEKTHNLDACVIASQGKIFLFTIKFMYEKRCINRGDYQRTKGVRSEKLLPKGKICGFKKFDKVLYLGKEYFIKGRRSNGTCNLMQLDGAMVSFDTIPKGFKTPKLKNCIKIGSRTGVLVQQKII